MKSRFLVLLTTLIAAAIGALTVYVATAQSQVPAARHVAIGASSHGANRSESVAWFVDSASNRVIVCRSNLAAVLSFECLAKSVP